MVQVNFYSLGKQHDEQDGPLLAACRIADKAHSLGHQVYIWVANSSQGERLDSLLWSFRPSSFLPHRIDSNDEFQQAEPILIGFGCPNADQASVLINLSGSMPSPLEAFNRINEIVGPDESSLIAGRQRYRHYQQTGLNLANFPL